MMLMIASQLNLTALVRFMSEINISVGTNLLYIFSTHSGHQIMVLVPPVLSCFQREDNCSCAGREQQRDSVV